jgi:hypothetical protein
LCVDRAGRLARSHAGSGHESGGRHYPAVVDYHLFCSGLHGLDKGAELAQLWRIDADRVRVNLVDLAECNA